MTQVDASPRLDDRGRVVWRDDDEVIHEWASLTDLAIDWWRYQRLTEKEKDADSMVARECVEEFVNPVCAEKPHPLAVDVIQALVDAAADGDDLGQVGAGPLEDLVSHSGQGALVVDEVERRARHDPRFRAALRDVWLGDDVAPDVRARLAQLGATDLTKPPRPRRKR
jgi:hypothetical protein